MKRFMVLIAMVMLLAACTPTDIKTTPNIALHFAAALEAKNFKSLYKMMWDHGSIVSEKDFTSQWEYILNSLEVKEIEVSNEKIALEDETPFLYYDTTYSTELVGDMTFQCKTRVIEEQEATYIEYLPSMVLPNYENGDKISISTLTGKRGEIFTADGTLIAKNDFAETVYIKVRKDLNVNRTISNLTDVVGLTDEQAIKIKKDYDTALEKDYAAVTVKAMPKGSIDDEFALKLSGIDGVEVDKTSMTPLRYYPYGSIYSHVTGYTGAPDDKQLKELTDKGYSKSSIVGRTGLESAYNEWMLGKDGYRVSLLDANMRLKEILFEKPRVNGQDLILSIDSSIQQRAHYLMASYLTEGQTGIALVLNAKTAEVLCSSSYKTFDPNIFSFPVPEDVYQDLIDPKKGMPVYNRITQGLYAPGSLMKPFSIVPSIDSGRVNANTVFPYENEVKGNSWMPRVAGWYWKLPINRATKTKPPMSMKNCMMNSDNIYFAWAAMELGQEEFLKYMARIGVGEILPYDIPVAKSNLINKNEEWTIRLLADTAFGHGNLLFPPIQIAAMYTAFSSGGDILVPTLVSSSYRDDGIQRELLYERETKIFKEDVISQTALRELIPTLQAVIEEGTARSVRVEGKTLAAKTGIALKGEDKTMENSWIAVWECDVENPKLVLIMIEGPRTGGKSKTKIARDLIKDEEPIPEPTLPPEPSVEPTIPRPSASFMPTESTTPTASPTSMASSTPTVSPTYQASAPPSPSTSASTTPSPSSTYVVVV